MAARTEVPRASINSFTTTFPSFYNHEIRFATSNRCLVYGIKCLKTFAVNFASYTHFVRFCLLFTSTLHGITLPKVTESFKRLWPGLWKCDFRRILHELRFYLSYVLQVLCIWSEFEWVELDIPFASYSSLNFYAFWCITTGIRKNIMHWLIISVISPYIPNIIEEIELTRCTQKNVQNGD